MRQALLLILFSIIQSAFGQFPTDISGKKTEQQKTTSFKYALDFPTITDTSNFIAELRNSFNLEVDESPSKKQNEKITFYQKVKIYGSDKDYIFIEYDYRNGCMAAYPWKYQLLLTTTGKLIKILAAQRFEFLEIFPNQYPFLVAVIATAKGNGGHEIYKITADTLENVYEGYYNYKIQTFDSHQDNQIYEPNELKIIVKDFNKDGYNDIAFKGNLIYIQGITPKGVWFDDALINGKTVSYNIDNPFKKIPVEFMFLYNLKTGHFKAKEDYNKKYKLYD
jgi:hypothetical protein